MKKLFYLLFVLMLSSALFSQIGWDSAGVPIRNGVNIEWFRAGTATNDGNIVYVWSDTRNGDRDVWAQKVDENGNTLWDNGGKLINGEVNRQEDIVIINTDNSLITAWVDFRNEESGDIYAQKLDYDGNIQWASEGIPLCVVPDIQISLNIVADNQGGAYIIWIDHRNGNNDIYGVHLNSDGSLVNGWQQNGNPIVTAPGSQYGHTFWEDGEGGAILVWTDGQEVESKNIFAQRIAPDGTLMWGQNGIPICNESGNQTNPKISPDGTGNFIITWLDKRITGNNGDIYAQRINLSGEKLWSNDLLVYGDSDYQENPRIRQANDNGVFITWQDSRNEENTEDIYVQKISPDGQLLWNSDGIPVVTQPYIQKNPRIVSDNSNGCWIIWDDARNNDYPNIDIYIQHLNGNGENLLEENGRLVCNADEVQFSPLLKKSTTGYIFANWADNRGGFTGIYYQTYDENNNELLENNGKLIFTGLSGNARNFVVKKNYYGIPAIFWVDSRFSSGKTIYFQEINHYANFMLPENGFQITSPYNIADDTKNFEVKMNPVKDEIALAFKKQILDQQKIYFQLFDSNGNIQFPSSGFATCSDTLMLGTQKFPSVSILDAENSAYMVVWSDSRIVGSDFTTFKIFAQKIQNGNRLWGEQGKLIFADPTQSNDLNVQTAIGPYIIWNTEQYNNKDLFILKIDENGNPAEGWNEGGLAITQAPDLQEYSKSVMTPQGILCIWEDMRNGNYDIYGQLISPDGNILWQEDGKPLVVRDRDQVFSNIIVKDDYFVISWSDNINNTETHIKQRKFDFNGDPVWSAPTDIITGGFNAISPTQATTESNDFYVFWSDYRVEGESNLYAQKVDNNGNILWDNNGMMICDALKNQNAPAAITDEDNYVYTFWEDTRASGKSDIYAIYGQVLTDDAYSDDNTVPNDNIKISVKNYPNPFKTATRFAISSPTKKNLNGKIYIYNLKGQLIKKLNVTDNTAILDEKSTEKMASGIYFYKLISKSGESAPKKMVILK